MKTARLVLCVSLLVVGLGLSVGAFQFGRPDGSVLLFGILPGLPFFALAGASLVGRVPVRMTAGASIGCLLAVAVSYGPLVYSSANYRGGGANIGAGLLLLAGPLLMLVLALIGGFAGWRWGGGRKQEI